MKLINIGTLNLVGLIGDGSKTAELWNNFDKKISNVTGDAYEVRFFKKDGCDCFVGVEALNKTTTDFITLTIPESEYVVFDVLVANGYDSENVNMEKWIEDNKTNYRQNEINGNKFVVEIFGERFSEGIVEICIPITKINN